MKVNKSSLKTTWQILLAAAVVAGCGALSEAKRDAAEAPSLMAPIGTGCVQGVVINGLTGDRIQMREFDGANGVYVMVRDQFVSTSNLGLNDSNKETLTGQYAVCGIPTDEDYALFARQDGFQTFEGIIHIESTVAPKGPSIKTHLVKSSPSMEANIVMYPSGTKTQDLKFSVYYNGTGIKDAAVQLRPTGRNALEDMEKQSSTKTDNRLLAPRDLRAKTLNATTNEFGEASFPKDELVLGGIYRYIVLPPDSMTYVGAELDATGLVVVGLQTTGAGRDPYRYSAQLRPMSAELKVVQTSIESQSMSPDGTLSMIFSRPVEIVSTGDETTAKLSNAVDAELAAEVPLNFASDTMSVTLSKDKTALTVKPIFKTLPTAAREPALSITYSGIRVRPASAPGNATVLSVPAYTVKFFGMDVNPALIPLKLVKMAGSDSQSGRPSTQLPNPIAVKVFDQFGLGLRNQSVVFTIGAGAGTIKKTTDASFASSVTVVTDRDGVASVNWALGVAAGEQTVLARLGSLEVLTFSAVSTVNPQ